MPEPVQKPMISDRIEKKILLRAPLKRVWRALCDFKEFGAWFGVKFDAPFKPGARISGKIVGTAVDAEVAKLQKQQERVPFEITIERIEPERLFSFRWHPHAIEPPAGSQGVGIGDRAAPLCPAFCGARRHDPPAPCVSTLPGRIGFHQQADRGLRRHASSYHQASA